MEGLCRACLNKFDEPTELRQYCESNRRLFVYCTGLQVKRNDTFTFQLCKECYLNLKFSCKFKKQCRTSDKKFKSYLALKIDGESTDFSTYLKNIEDTLTLRLPTASSSSTPQKKKYDEEDDDNVSTCTSIQNFMTDMLQGEEVLPTEARIIREVIQEEADILDDSLDSHWLQDDMSIDSDFGMDFNFAGFSTPHSINNDHCYTPRRLTNDKEEDTYYYAPKDAIQESEEILPHDQKDMPLLEIADNNYREHTDSKYDLESIIDRDKQAIDTSNQNNMALHMDCDIEIDGIVENNIVMDDLDTGHRIESTEKLKNKQITIILNKGVASKGTNSPLTNELEYYMNKVELNRTYGVEDDKRKSQNNDKNIDTVLNQNIVNTINQSILTQDFDIDIEKFNLNQDDIQNMASPVKCELDQYINKAELKKKVYIALNQSKNIKNYNEKDSIDRNLEMALRNDDSQEFSLDQLLISPQVSIRSGASTPTINNILFGNLTPRDTSTDITDLNNIAVKKNQPDPADFIKEFLKDNQRLSTPDTIFKGEHRQIIALKDLNKLKESKVKTQWNIGVKKDLRRELKKSKHKKEKKRNRGFKDIKRLKDLIKFEDEKSDMMDSEQPHLIAQPDNTAKAINITEMGDIEINNTENGDTEICNTENNNSKTDNTENDNTKIDKIELDNVKIDNIENYNTEIDNIENDNTEDDNPEIDNKEDKDPLPKNVNDDLEISISKLLDFEDNQSVDLNISISSDFLEEEHLDEDEIDLKDPDHIFKMPFSPPDSKYDLDKNLCKICDKIFKNNQALKIHFFKAHKQKLPKAKPKVVAKLNICQTCGKQFRDKSYLLRHIKLHEDPDNFNCKYCTLNFPTRGRFNQHMRMHANEIARKENNGSATQDKDDNDKNYDQCEEEANSKRYVCSTCGKGFKTNSNYHMHMRRHNKTYSMSCMICQKGFFRKYDLDMHMAAHNKEHTFACQYCTKKYRSRHLLVGHMYQHMGKYKYNCEVCDRKFISMQYLKQHFKTEMCVRNRKALETGEKADVTVTYKPVKHQESLAECPEDLSKDDTIDTIEIKTELCLELDEDEESNNEPSISSSKAN